MLHTRSKFLYFCQMFQLHKNIYPSDICKYIKINSLNTDQRNSKVNLTARGRTNRKKRERFERKTDNLYGFIKYAALALSSCPCARPSFYVPSHPHSLNYPVSCLQTSIIRCVVSSHPFVTSGVLPGSTTNS